MTKFWVSFLIVLMLALAVATVSAESGEPTGGCPNSFHLHNIMGHDHMSMGTHHHIGNDRDFNGDGWICGKHVGATDNNHVHIDNNVPPP